MTDLSETPADEQLTALEGAHLTALGGPHDVRALPTGQLAALAQDIRTFLIEKVCASGGHLGSNLGIVELTIALHRKSEDQR
jgi:1-deoxy-D-xylulose-5-phosphate synthase